MSYYFTLGNDELAKWTVKVSSDRCEVKLGKPEGGQADCVLKTSSESSPRSSVSPTCPGRAIPLGGHKSNDVSLLLTFQKIFQLEHHEARPRHRSHGLPRLARRRALRARGARVVALSRGSVGQSRGRASSTRRVTCSTGRAWRRLRRVRRRRPLRGGVSRDPKDAEAIRRLHVGGTRACLDACEAQA